MKPSHLILAVSFLSAIHAGAAVVLQAQYHLGEVGSLSGANNLPQDSSGNNKHFTSELSGANAVVGTAGVVAAGSTAYLNTTTSNVGWFNADFSGLATDNFGLGIYARASSLSVNQQTIISLGNAAAGYFQLQTGSNGWAASSEGLAWIGNTNGTSGSFTANTWAHLALIRDNGITSFYINGVAQSGTYAVAPVHGLGHLAVKPGGATGRWFNGDIDEARVVTFTSGESTANILNSLTAIPEPSSAALLGLGALALVLRRRK